MPRIARPFLRNPNYLYKFRPERTGVAGSAGLVVCVPVETIECSDTVERTRLNPYSDDCFQFEEESIPSTIKLNYTEFSFGDLPDPELNRDYDPRAAGTHQVTLALNSVPNQARHPTNARHIWSLLDSTHAGKTYVYNEDTYNYTRSYSVGFRAGNGSILNAWCVQMYFDAWYVTLGLRQFNLTAIDSYGAAWKSGREPTVYGDYDYFAQDFDDENSGKLWLLDAAKWYVNSVSIEAQY